MDTTSRTGRCRRAARGLLAATALLLIQTGAWGHAFLTRSDPPVGATVGAPPARIRVWFDGPIEPLFATIRVENRDKQRVDAGDGRVNPVDNNLLEVSVASLPSGRYRVFWSVIARDGHRKDGDFPFRVR
jgi:methionine-rich copper-binding protein CopC